MNAPVSSFTPGMLVESPAARVSAAVACTRLSLRARGDLAPFEAALGLSLDGQIGSRSSSGVLEAMRLGPDEWILHGSKDAAASAVTELAGLYANHPHSLVDVSGREVSFVIEGPRAAELLTIGCPRNIETILPGSGRRTSFDGVTVVLWRDAETSFRMDVWNSFASHLLDLLATGCRELAAEIH
ncbi:sarcosine oxidase subunit gamma [Salipiger bermudensis]|uniref:sarcosine oxidase subunit gamma n=1 Tax=Salipiger bermudensis TaxID=344736 RepID=UPI001C998BC9|nr:sarcosine oxidase subunit gamma [Salipiger bermudensis]MBY6004161.1 sarcosine oxidase subunit gamma [Salipiger bermudensis]